jgi:hypothetical protein
MVRHYRQGYKDDDEGWKSIVTALDAGRELSEEYGFQLVVTVYPVLIHLDERRYPFSAIHKKIGTFCHSRGIQFVDLLECFLGQTDRDMWVHPTDQHPNEVAQALAGQFLAKSVSEHLVIGQGGDSQDPR